MPATIHLDRGEGPGVVLLHGVGAGPATFATVADDLAHDHHVLVVERPVGGRGLGEAVDLAEQVEQVVALLTQERAVGVAVVGVSGGATLALDLAIRHPGVATGLVVHEPLLGHQAPALHRRFAEAAAQAEAGDEAALAVVRSVMGEPAWAALDPAVRADAAAGAARWRAEIPQFAAFDPSQDDLRALVGLPILCTVGATSGPERHAAAAALARLAGAEVTVVAGAGNAVQLDAPHAFAQLVRTWLALPAGARS